MDSLVVCCDCDCDCVCVAKAILRFKCDSLDSLSLSLSSSGLLTLFVEKHKTECVTLIVLLVPLLKSV